jgi:hypothetical protein
MLISMQIEGAMAKMALLMSVSKALSSIFRIADYPALQSRQLSKRSIQLWGAEGKISVPKEPGRSYHTLTNGAHHNSAALLGGSALGDGVMPSSGGEAFLGQA